MSTEPFNGDTERLERVFGIVTPSMLQLYNALGDELKAVGDYQTRARECGERGDTKTAEMFSHMWQDKLRRIVEITRRISEIAVESGNQRRR